MKIFVVDDDPAMLDLITGLLGAAGHETEGCLAGAYALPKMVEMEPDVILTDLMMSEVDGLELCSEIQARDELKQAKIIFVSGKEHSHWKDQARECGAVGYITKPLDPETFAAEVERLAASATGV